MMTEVKQKQKAAMRSAEDTIRHLTRRAIAKLKMPDVLRMRQLRAIDPVLEATCRRAYSGDKVGRRLAHVAASAIQEAGYERLTDVTDDFEYRRRPK